MTKAGTLRALAIDFAFIRMEQLKQEDKYYELDKLSTLICKLAPRFPTVWSYCAWNQAYNISVTQYTPQGRWYWVRNGIELLRKEGIPYNEKSIGLYRSSLELQEGTGRRDGTRRGGPRCNRPGPGGYRLLHPHR